MMLARCPACQTVFRVRPEQLRAHAGQVRCGHCFDAFNALEHLLDDPPQPHPAAEAPSPQAPGESAATSRFESVFVLEERPEGSVAPKSDLDFEIPAAPTRASADSRPSPMPDGLGFELPPEPVRPRPRPEPRETPEVRDEPIAAPPMQEKHEFAAAPVPPPAEAPPPFDAAHENHSAPAFDTASAGEPTEHFVADAPLQDDDAALDQRYGPIAPRDHKNQSLSGLLAGLLIGTLAAQSIYLFRSEIARDWPALRPALAAACVPLQCTVPLPQQASEISVEASELQAEPGNGGRYTLHATVRNRAPYLQRLPHLELTLLDGREQALARRVFAPQEWAAVANVEQGFAANSELAVTLPFETRNLEPAGYRLYVFYP